MNPTISPAGKTLPVQCENCGRALPVEIPIGVTGEFYCCEKCRKAVRDPPKMVRTRTNLSLGAERPPVNSRAESQAAEATGDVSHTVTGPGIV